VHDDIRNVETPLNELKEKLDEIFNPSLHVRVKKIKGITFIQH
jgi:hypothetical protein